MGLLIIRRGRVVLVSGFEGDRTEHFYAGMPPFCVVPALYPFEDGVGKPGARLPGSRVEDLEL